MKDQNSPKKKAMAHVLHEVTRTTPEQVLFLEQALKQLQNENKKPLSSTARDKRKWN